LPVRDIAEPMTISPQAAMLVCENNRVNAANTADNMDSFFILLLTIVELQL
jgi:hypothetical protein